jgi:hypothetical protein
MFGRVIIGAALAASLPLCALADPLPVGAAD